MSKHIVDNGELQNCCVWSKVLMQHGKLVKLADTDQFRRLNENLMSSRKHLCYGSSTDIQMTMDFCEREKTWKRKLSPSMLPLNSQMCLSAFIR